MNEQLVSIIMPVFNAEKYLADAINSCLDQTHKDFELICVDDCSTDSSYEILNEFQKKDPRIKVFQSKRNGGTSVARNFAIKVSQGRYISFLDSDDMYKPEFLEKQISFSRQKGPLVYCSIDRLANKSCTTWTVREKQNIKGCLTGDDIATSASLFDTNILGRPLFDESLKINEDTLYWVEMLKKCGWAYGNKESLVFYRIVKKSKSRNKIRSAKYMWAIYREKCNLNFFTALYYLLRISIYSILKYSNVK